MKKKAQAWNLDFIIGLSLFVIAMGIISAASINSFAGDTNDVRDIEAETQTIAAILMSNGFPSNWTNATVIQPGLTDGNYIIQGSKLDAFANFTAQDLKRMFQARSDFSIAIIDSAGNTLLTAGSPIPESPTTLVVTTRLAVINSTVVRLEVKGWR